MWNGQRRHHERGLAPALEAAIVLPVAMLFVGLVVVLAGRYLAQQAVDEAAFAAARAAALERNPGEAKRAAYEAAKVQLGSSRVRCGDVAVSVDASELVSPPGSTASVAVRVTCAATFPISLPGFPATASLKGDGRSPVDTYRGRDG